MRGSTRLSAIAVLSVAWACATTVPAGAYQGNWGDNSTCPVDDPAMLGSPSGDLTACVSLGGGGTMKYGNLKMRGSIDQALGLYGPTGDSGSIVPSKVPMRGSAALDTSNLSVGWLLGPVCATFGPPTNHDPGPAYDACWTLVSQLDRETTITAAIQPAGPASSFRLSGLASGGAVITLPVKLRLINDAFGPNCYVGSDAQPIVLHLVASGYTSHTSSPDVNGYPVTFDRYTNIASGSLSDTTFAVPAAHGCGDNGSLDPVVNAVAGLPSATGNSVLLDRSAAVHSTTSGGSVLAAAYHAALGYPVF